MQYKKIKSLMILKLDKKKGRKAMKKYTVEEIERAVNYAYGDGGHLCKKVIDMLETDVEKNTQEYIKRKEEERKVKIN